MTMLRHELKDAWRSWWPTAVAIALAAAICATASIATRALGGLSASEAQSTRSYAAMLMAMTLLVTFAVVSTSVDLAIAARRRRLALLALAGLTPEQAGLLVYSQCAVVAVPAAAIGGAIAAATANSTARFITQGGAEVDPGARSGGVLGIVALTCSAVVLVAILAATRGARQARAVSPLEVLRRVDAPVTRRTGPRRLVVVASTVVLAIAVLTAVGTPIAARIIADNTGDDAWSPSTADGAISSGLLACLALTALLTATVSTWAPRLLGLIASLAHRAGSPTLKVASTLAREHAGRSTAAVAMITVATTLTGGLFSVFLTGADAFVRTGHPETASASGQINTTSIVTLLAGPFVLALAGAALTAATTMRERLSELTSIQIAGTTPRQTVLVPALETVLYAAVAGVVSLGASAALAIVVAIGFISQTAVAIHIAIVPIVAIPALGALLLSAATLPSVWRHSARPDLQRLAVE